MTLQLDRSWLSPVSVGPTPPMISGALGSPRIPSRRSIIDSHRIFSSLLGGFDPVMAVEVPPAVFRVVWFIIVGTHLMCAVFLTAEACVYWYLTNSTMFFYVKFWAPAVRQHDYAFYSVGFGLIGVLHALRVFQQIFRSIQVKRLTFRSKTALAVGSPTVNRIRSANPGVLARLLNKEFQRQIRQWIRTVRKMWRSLFAKRGVFGVESEHFVTIFVLREFVELSSQTYQAYRSSLYLPRIDLNTLLVGLLVTNCWSALAVDQFLSRKPALGRVVALSTDVLICIAMSIVNTILILAPSAAAFDISQHMFKNPAMSYHPVFITTFILENQLVFVTGPIDFIAKIIPHFSILFGLTTISEAVVRRSKTFNSVASTPPPQVAGPSRALISAQRSRWRWMHASVKIIFCLWGAGVLGCHLHATYQAHSSVVPGCLASTRPWLSIRASCFSYVVNCHSRDIVSPSDEIFENLNILALTTLTFAHCPALRMPSALQRFKNLMILHVYNSTVLEWIEQNSLTPSVHTRMIVVAAVRTKFLAGFPTGLLKPLPTSLVSIQFSITDLKSLPDTLASFWHPMASVSFEYGELTTFPASLLSLQTASLSLKRNRLQNVPQLADLPPDLTVTQVILGGNPLSELPSSLKNPTDFFGRLDLEGTTISSLPAWTKAQVLAVVYMNGTPYCSDTVRQFNAQCSPRSATDNRVEFPISLMDELYAIDKG